MWNVVLYLVVLHWHGHWGVNHLRPLKLVKLRQFCESHHYDDVTELSIVTGILLNVDVTLFYYYGLLRIRYLYCITGKWLSHEDGGWQKAGSQPTLGKASYTRATCTQTSMWLDMSWTRICQPLRRSSRRSEPPSWRGECRPRLPSPDRLRLRADPPMGRRDLGHWECSTRRASVGHHWRQPTGLGTLPSEVM